MAKKSAASLSVVTTLPKDERLAPARALTDRQKTLWLEIVASKPARWFDRATSPLLAAYVKAIASHEVISQRVDAMEAGGHIGGFEALKDEDKLYAMLERQARLVQSFATKLRLTQQSRYTPDTAAVQAGKASGTRPWDEPK